MATGPNGRHFPSKDEAEYTAHLCFALVVACSHWAVRHGLAVLRIQRMPPMQTASEWRPLLDLPAETFRQWSMPALASFLGLSLLKSSPRRVPVSDVWGPGQSLPPASVYIGHGHFSHRLPCTEWENPFLEGRDGSAHEVLLRYISWFQGSNH